MAVCTSCEEEFSDKRYALGYSTCLSCGDKLATKRARILAHSSAPQYNKGAYQPIVSIRDAKWVGK